MKPQQRFEAYESENDGSNRRDIGGYGMSHIIGNIYWMHYIFGDIDFSLHRLKKIWWKFYRRERYSSVKAEDHSLE